MLFVNAFNVVQGGGVNVVRNFLKYLISIEENVLAALPDNILYRDLINENINYGKLKVIWFRADKMRYFSKYYILNFYLNELVRIYRVKKVYSLGNIAFKSDCPQVLLIQNAYAVLDDKSVWSRFSLFNRCYLTCMKREILKRMKFANRVLVQTEAMKKAVIKHGGLDAKMVSVIPNVLDLSVLKNNSSSHFDGSQLKLLFLSKYYPHKNFEVLVPLCEALGSSLNISITVTLDNRIKKEKILLNRLEKFAHIIKNVGPVPYSELSALYESHDGIFLPTLLESFSSTYIEAMFFKKLIFTSDREFAKEICGNLAYYFNPHSIDDIIAKFKDALAYPNAANDKVAKYFARLEAVASVNQTDVNSKLLNSI